MFRKLRKSKINKNEHNKLRNNKTKYNSKIKIILLILIIFG